MKIYLVELRCKNSDNTMILRGVAQDTEQAQEKAMQKAMQNGMCEPEVVSFNELGAKDF